MATNGSPNETQSVISTMKANVSQISEINNVSTNVSADAVVSSPDGYKSPVVIKDKSVKNFVFGNSSTSLRAYSTTPNENVNSHGGMVEGMTERYIDYLTGALSSAYSLEAVRSEDFSERMHDINVLTGYMFNDEIVKLQRQTDEYSSVAFITNDQVSIERARSNAISAANVLRSRYSTAKRDGIIDTSSIKTTYEMSYNNLDDGRNIKEMLVPLHRSLNIYDSSSYDKEWYWHQYTTFYNRFKVATTDDCLMRGFGHVFFTRPDCNLFDTDTISLSGAVKNKPMFASAFTNSPDILFELTQTFNKAISKTRGQKSHFMLSLSNKANNFSVNEDYVGTTATGRTYTGYQIVYGKNNIESKSHGSFSIEFTDDKSLHIYQVIRLWMEYISGCYRGTIVPKESDLLNRVIDYCSSLYYVITDETGENIIYWEKFYGIFPSNISNDSLSWQNGDTIRNPKFNVTFQYSFRSSLEPTLFTEFNYNSFSLNELNKKATKNYTPIFDKDAGHTADSWVGIPFIETVIDTNGRNIYKLRFIDNSSLLAEEFG